MGKIIVPNGKNIFQKIFFPIFPYATLERNNEVPNQSNLLGLRKENLKNLSSYEDFTKVLWFLKVQNDVKSVRIQK